ncbi:MAG TPA: hypothetical protein VMT99_01595 [Candidatus Paceibacterota bacterium]|nr:hypothetical protein [Candidatus Paceibacterota bacterium]
MKRFLAITFIFITAGLAFSGYLSIVKLTSGSCAFGEQCPTFLGYPACWYGFAMYFLMFAMTLQALTGAGRMRAALLTDVFVAFVGLIFSGSFIVQEIAANAAVGGPLALSTCVYGFACYLAILILSIVGANKPQTPAA